MKKLIALLVVAFFVAGCVPTHYVRYDIGLKEVERPSDAKKRYGEPKIVQFEEEGKTKYSFEDGMLKIVWLPISSQFGFFLTNKTSHSIKIVWDEAVYVDESGVSKRVMHSGVKYIDRNNPQPFTTVARGATISDIVLPTDNVYYLSGLGWRESPLLPNSGTQKPEIENKARGVVGKNVQVLLPIKIEDVVNEYVFVFSIDGYSITTE
ncbi:MAG: hypothetical protein WD558_01165 [Pseudomonadales bacterium]